MRGGTFITFNSNRPESPFMEGQLLDIITFYETHVSSSGSHPLPSGASLTICQPADYAPLQKANRAAVSPTAYLFVAGRPTCPFTEIQTISDIKDYETWNDTNYKYQDSEVAVPTKAP